MAGFQFERDLPHQTAAVEAVVLALDSVGYTEPQEPCQNRLMDFERNFTTLANNIRGLQKTAGLNSSVALASAADVMLDVSMETGTGKTYAYTKTIFELNKQYGLFKFIIAVPRVAIKAGTVGFLTSEAAREHFKHDYDGKELKVYEVHSVKKNKGKKESMPASIVEFYQADVRTSPKTIQVLVVNSGMINSPTMGKKFDRYLGDRFAIAHEAVAHTRPVLMIDEPHLFKEDNKTFDNLRRFKPQLTVRYGATFDGAFKNLVYQLTAVDAFNQDLVKGIVAHVEKFDAANHTSLKLTGLDGVEATFELTHNDKKSIFKLGKNESFEKIHPEMLGLSTTKELNKTKLMLSNGLELRKGDTLNPFSYAQTLQNNMIQQAITRHFEIERQLLCESPRIKPLSLFFIDNIPSYRDKDGAMRTFFEQSLKAHIQSLIAVEADAAYKQHLEVALKDVSKLHGGYFSADNSDKDEAIEKETLEILHDKELLLRLDNPRRFIFSKWTLREGWDNPNIFQICKLRSSGSETSKLQEVGRGLRLPVNEFMSRDKSRAHDLHYYVDFTERDFIGKLTQEINDKSGVGFNLDKLDDGLIQAILAAYPEFKGDDEALLETLGDAGIIKRNNDFKEGGLDRLKQTHPLAFQTGLKAGKVTVSGANKTQVSIRQGKYDELKALWESINQKVVLEYKLDETQDFKHLFKNYVLTHKNQFVQTGSMSEQQRLIVERNQVSYRTEHSIHAQILPFKMMGYKAFVTALSKELALDVTMLHAVLGDLLRSKALDINPYMSLATIRAMKSGFNEYLMQQVFGKFQVNYRKTSNCVHPTKFTDATGRVKTTIDSGDVGVYADAVGTPHENYLFNEVFYDSMLELNNITNPPQEVIVYAKIPKNSIRIPLVGGGTYSPDFAYVVKSHDGRSELNFVVESKDKTQLGLGGDEAQKIEHAKAMFEQLGALFDVKFVTQLKNSEISGLIGEAMQG
jgi:type III restriction enzyme